MTEVVQEVLVYSRGSMTLQSFKFVDGSHEPTGVHPPVQQKSILSAFNGGGVGVDHFTRYDSWIPEVGRWDCLVEERR